MEQTAIRIGNSVGVVIPQPIRRQMGLKPGDKVVIETDTTGREIVVRRGDKKAARSSITPEFLSWLDKFNKRYSKALKELAEK